MVPLWHNHLWIWNRLKSNKGCQTEEQIILYHIAVLSISTSVSPLLSMKPQSWHYCLLSRQQWCQLHSRWWRRNWQPCSLNPWASVLQWILQNLTVKLCITLADCFLWLQHLLHSIWNVHNSSWVRNIVKSADFVSGAAFKVSRAKEFSIFLL